MSACSSCQGTLNYDLSAADGLGYTYCLGGQRPQQAESTPAPQQASKSPAQQEDVSFLACGAGVGDLRTSSISMSACSSCQGTLSHDRSASDGLGYTYCQKSTPAPPQVSMSMFAQWTGAVTSLGMIMISLLALVLVTVRGSWKLVRSRFAASGLPWVRSDAAWQPQVQEKGNDDEALEKVATQTIEKSKGMEICFKV